ncbi:hypothetical protein [Mycolicibacterium sp. CR10]|nr:hypothetical protein [Mycolicibacterium sp. CR10]
MNPKITVDEIAAPMVELQAYVRATVARFEADLWQEIHAQLEADRG